MTPGKWAGAALLALLAACGDQATRKTTAGKTGARDTIVVEVAASLYFPIREMAESLSKSEHFSARIETGASLDLARRVTDLAQPVDVMVLADDDVITGLLMPKHASWHAPFAHNRMVVAFTKKSRHESELRPSNWYTVLSRPDVRVGRADPKVAPVGYNAMLMLELAQQYYRVHRLANDVMARAGKGGVAQNAATLATLLETGEVDYILDYESVARQHNFNFLALPPEIDLGDPRQAPTYSTVTLTLVRVPGDTMRIRARPITYGITTPLKAPHAASARKFADYLLSPAGKAILRRNHVDVMDPTPIMGDRRP